jgi:hypothetical protein
MLSSVDPYISRKVSMMCMYSAGTRMTTKDAIHESSDLTPLIPLLISLLNPVNPTIARFEESSFVAASDALQEVMAKSALSDGGGAATLTEPLLLWIEAWGQKIVSESHACKHFLVMLHSNTALINCNSGNGGRSLPFFVQAPLCVRRALARMACQESREPDAC